MRAPGIEPGALAWEARILPLNQARFSIILRQTDRYLKYIYTARLDCQLSRTIQRLSNVYLLTSPRDAV